MNKIYRYCLVTFTAFSFIFSACNTSLADTEDIDSIEVIQDVPATTEEGLRYVKVSLGSASASTARTAYPDFTSALADDEKKDTILANFTEFTLEGTRANPAATITKTWVKGDNESAYASLSADPYVTLTYKGTEGDAKESWSFTLKAKYGGKFTDDVLQDGTYTEFTSAPVTVEIDEQSVTDLSFSLSRSSKFGVDSSKYGKLKINFTYADNASVKSLIANVYTLSSYRAHEEDPEAPLQSITSQQAAGNNINTCFCN